MERRLTDFWWNITSLTVAKIKKYDNLRTILPPDVEYPEILPIHGASTLSYKITVHKCTTTSGGNSPPRSHGMFSTRWNFSVVQNLVLSSNPGVLSVHSVPELGILRGCNLKYYYYQVLEYAYMLVDFDEICGKLAYDDIASYYFRL